MSTVTALMTAPRYTCTTARNYIEIALRSLGIPLAVSSGVYYGQCMQSMLESAVDSGTDFAITVDGDSLFTAQQVRRLVETVLADDEIDALAPLQVRRGQGTLLATCGARDAKWDGTPVKVETAHFGCTVLRMAALQEVPKPWFYAEPNSEGRWTGGKTDDDVWFWRQWTGAGRSVFVDPAVRIGHIEEMVAAVDDKMQTVYMQPGDWLKQHGGGQ